MANASLDAEEARNRTDPSQDQPMHFQKSSFSTTAMAPQPRKNKKFVLCFDGTGNKFSGTDADSNILKIYRMLDRSGDDQFHYYQPGIGTYIISNSSKTGSHTSRIDRIKSWYKKAKDSAVGTSFDEHVMGGYRFLMRYYSAGDELYFFGFSRGAYTARFLAEMLDHVGLLSAGNEEMCHFAWKTFQRWQCRQERTGDEKQQKKYLLDFMCAFRETFSRPVMAIRFLGLFDTVNSVPRFESAWMQRSKFPYTARSSAKTIRHAVAIDERRAKFRQDLISGPKPDRSAQYKHRHHLHHPHLRPHSPHHNHTAISTNGNVEKANKNEVAGEDVEHRGRKLSLPHDAARRDTLAVPERYRSPSETAGVRSLSPGRYFSQRNGVSSAASSVSNHSFHVVQDRRTADAEAGEAEEPQDIKEVWFPGCHADIGGGWPLSEGEDVALSHVPLVWMVREAQRAGLPFDEVKLRALNCSHTSEEEEEEEEGYNGTPNTQAREEPLTSNPVPTIAIDPASPHAPDNHSDISPKGTPQLRSSTASDERKTTTTATNNTTVGDYQFPHPPQTKHHKHHRSPFHAHLHTSATRGAIHDVLQLNNGVPHLSVLSWNIMEYLPFRRMDLQEDGSWKAITWPLPKGETRDMPREAMVHGSVIERMKADPEYRPGNLIVGGGGRGVRRAPEEMGMGRWKVVCEEGDLVGECWVRSDAVV